MPPGCNSTLSSIYLALLCKSEYVKSYGYETILEPPLQELITLEIHGVYVPELARFVKGTVQSVIADNLGAHGLADFLESFSGEYFCRLCVGERLEIQTESV